MACREDRTADGSADFHQRQGDRRLRRSACARARRQARRALVAVSVALGCAFGFRSSHSHAQAFARPALGYGAHAWRDSGLGAIRGATLGPIENSLHPNVGYGTDASARALDELRALGCNWVSITPFGRLWDLHATEIYLDFEQPFLENREAVKRVIAQAHERGMRVLLVPHLWIDTPGQWRGEIDAGSEERWARWFRSYTRFVLAWARVAQESGAEMLSLGVEMKSTSQTRVRDWIAVIEAVRRSYGGLLTYSANWDEESQAGFWDRLDVVGINAFYPLAERNGASLATLRAGALDRARRLGEWARREGRAVMFTEYGYTARPDPAVRPWEWPDSMAGVPVDERAQEEAYRALLEAFIREPWFVGAFVWRYYANPMDSSQEAAHGFSPRLRDAERAMHDLYSIRWESDGVTPSPWPMWWTTPQSERESWRGAATWTRR